MIFIDYFEDITSERRIAWRCEDSRSSARFLGYTSGESTPEHSTQSLTRERLPMEVQQFAFELILTAVSEHGFLNEKQLVLMQLTRKPPHRSRVLSVKTTVITGAIVSVNYTPTKPARMIRQMRKFVSVRKPRYFAVLTERTASAVWGFRESLQRIVRE